MAFVINTAVDVQSALWTCMHVCAHVFADIKGAKIIPKKLWQRKEALSEPALLGLPAIGEGTLTGEKKARGFRAAHWLSKDACPAWGKAETSGFSQCNL